MRTWLALCLLIVMAFANWEDTHDWRQKMTLVVQTPEGEVTGSAIQAIEWSKKSELAHKWLPGVMGSGARFTVTGEALVIEVAPGRFLFALLRGATQSLGSPGRNMAHAAQQQAGGSGPVGDLQSIRHVRRTPKDRPLPLRPEALPMLVTFADPADPSTAVQVDPADLAATFGPGFALKGVTVEVTQDPVTDGKVATALGTGFFQAWAKMRKTAAGHGAGAPFLQTLASELDTWNFVATAQRW